MREDGATGASVMVAAADAFSLPAFLTMLAWPLVPATLRTYSDISVRRARSAWPEGSLLPPARGPAGADWMCDTPRTLRSCDRALAASVAPPSAARRRRGAGCCLHASRRSQAAQRAPLRAPPWTHTKRAHRPRPSNSSSSALMISRGSRRL